jgi:hypothetical protein
MQPLPTLVFKALADSGYDLLQPLEDGWFLAAVSGSPVRVAVSVMDADTLLEVNYDALFDKGLIAFNDEGELLISTLLTREARTVLNLDASMRLHFILPGHRRYLAYHRIHVAEQVSRNVAMGSVDG